MKISYPHVFQDSGNEVEAGYVLNIAFVRLLRSLASGYHTFYDENEQRVTLQDSEVQLIEQGIKGLTIEMALPKIVFRGTLAVPLVAEHGSETVIDWNDDYLDQQHVSYTNSIMTLGEGSYLFIHLYRIDNISAAVNWYHRMRMRTAPNALYRVNEQFYGSVVNAVLTSSFTALITNPTPIWWTFEQFSGGLRGLRSGSSDTRLEIVKIG